jgi:hypothetical protein
LEHTINYAWQYITFGRKIQAEKKIKGYIIADKIVLGYWFSTDKYYNFFQTTIKQAKFS